jgi:hypothetical protein
MRYAQSSQCLLSSFILVSKAHALVERWLKRCGLSNEVPFWGLIWLKICLGGPDFPKTPTCAGRNTDFLQKNFTSISQHIVNTKWWRTSQNYNSASAITTQVSREIPSEVMFFNKPMSKLQPEFNHGVSHNTNACEQIINDIMQLTIIQVASWKMFAKNFHLDKIYLTCMLNLAIK